MKIERHFKPELCAFPDLLRHNLMEPYLTEYDGKPAVVATNGMILAIVPAEMVEGDCHGQVTKRALNEARRQAPKPVKTRLGMSFSSPAASMQASGDKFVMPDGTSFPRKAIEYPKFASVIPDPKRKGIRIGINPTLLMKLANALGSPKQVNLELGENTLDVIRVTTPDNRVLGCIMPMRIA